MWPARLFDDSGDLRPPPLPDTSFLLMNILHFAAPGCANPGAAFRLRRAAHAAARVDLNLSGGLQWTASGLGDAMGAIRGTIAQAGGSSCRACAAGLKLRSLQPVQCLRRCA